VYRPDVGYRIQSLSDPSLKDLSIGVVAGTPPATLLARYGLMGQTRPYLRTVDTRRYSPASDAVQAVATRDLDLAIIWGPIAGYAASQYSPPLRVVPLPALVDNVPLAFSVSMGVRDREKQWKHQINEIIARIEPRINAVLASFGVPLLDANNRPIEPQDAREAP
jgi:ABC-type amino acid transport substrate-binding protein